MTDADVVVVGLGPAGATAARVIAGSGARVIAFDRKREAGKPVQCAELIPRIISAEAGDVHSALRQRIDEMQTFVERELADCAPNFPGHMIDRAAFDAKLVEYATSAGASCRLGTIVRAIDDTGLIITGKRERINARIVIGADGPHSLVGRAIGLCNTEFAETRQITVDLIAPYTATDIFLSSDIVGGYGWLFPKRTMANLGIGVSAAYKEDLKPLLNNLHDRLANEGRVGRRVLGITGGAIPVGGIKGPVGYLDRTPVLLAGDAAGLANPITGAGINAAVISGALAGEAALRCLEGDRLALRDYRDGIEDLFKPGIDRALRRREHLQSYYDVGTRPPPGALRQSWIAYDSYWKN
ncbi:MAG: NAD(P)/FAD-dependent oxidoreductase [Proteobacteria bacterium]|nr:NAD(P)/FAD-dependent oxidoreductase [Pseudomonadota bacterium]